VGLALHVIRSATPQGDFATPQQYWLVRERVDDGSSIIAAFLIAGAQAQTGPFAVFVQGSTSSAQTRSLWNLGGSSQLEAGLRVNLAAAFER
jgi:hypothetical protein